MPHKDKDKKRIYMQQWRERHPDLLSKQRRKELLAKATRSGRLPTQRAIDFHAFTQDELRPVVESMLANRGFCAKLQTAPAIIECA